MSLKRMWFGTRVFGEYIEAPARNADISPKGFSSETDLLNGGAATRTSRASHKVYQYEWPQSSSDLMAQKMKDYSDGVYGLGLIHHLDPNSMSKNAMPGHWGAPFLTAVDAPSLHNLVRPTMVNTPANDYGHPMLSAFYDLTALTPATEPANSLFLPIPPDKKLFLGVNGIRVGNGVMYVTPVLRDGTDAAPVVMPTSAVSAAGLTTNTFSGATYRGVRVWPGRGTGTGTHTLLLASVIAQIRPLSATAHSTGQWIGGMGHSGCEIVGKPSFLQYSGIAGGQAKFGVRLVEVGSWQLV